jgi:hypothetical protein
MSELAIALVITVLALSGIAGIVLWAAYAKVRKWAQQKEEMRRHVQSAR